MRVRLDHVLHQPQAAVTLQSQNRFGVKLHRFNGQVAVTNAHDDAVVRFRGNFKAGGKRVAIGIKRMITAHTKR